MKSLISFSGSDRPYVIQNNLWDPLEGRRQIANLQKKCPLSSPSVTPDLGGGGCCQTTYFILVFLFSRQHAGLTNNNDNKKKEAEVFKAKSERT